MLWPADPTDECVRRIRPAAETGTGLTTLHKFSDLHHIILA